MFTAANFYIIVGNNSFIIKKQGDASEKIIELQPFIPNVPDYHHLFDKDKKIYIQDITNQIKSLKIKKTVIIFPDDCLDLEVDKRILIEFLMQCGVKKIEVDFQCYFLSMTNKKYVSIAKTSRNIVVQYITYKSAVSKRYYEKDYADMERIALDIKQLHTDCEYEMIPVFINNINNDMEGFGAIGTLVSLKNFAENTMNS